jgi:hypothetical protein
MSKSYDNTIPLFSSRDQLKKLIGGMLTDSRAPWRTQGHRRLGPVPDLPGLCHPRRNRGPAPAYAEGIAWGDAKQVLFERVDRDVAPMRERYDDADPTLSASSRPCWRAPSAHAQMATPFMRELRSAVGLRSLAQTSSRQSRQGSQDRPAQLQAIPRSRRQVLLQARGRRWPPAAAKHGLRRAQGGRPGQGASTLRRGAHTWLTATPICCRLPCPKKGLPL